MTIHSTVQTQSLRARPAWKALEAHYNTIHHLHLRQLFADDPKRGERFTAEAAGIYFDYSKNRIIDETIKLLVQLAEDCGLRKHIDAMFGGEKINTTEKRAVLHTALRAAEGDQFIVDGRILSLMCTKCLIEWPHLRIRCEAEMVGIYRQTIRKLSTSESEVPTSAR